MKPRRGPNRLAALIGSSPSELLAATVQRAGDPVPTAFERGVRTAAAVSMVPAHWQWPRWLDRQLRPDHPAFVPCGDAAIIENLTGRDWRYVGTVSSGWLAAVDSRGLVVPADAPWSVDWLVRAEDRWHRPSRDAGVRQRIVGAAPVTETACRVPGGDVVQRVYGVALGGDLGDAVVIEIENTTAVPVGVALALRPVDVLGAGSIGQIALDDTRVLVDGRPVMVFERRPSRSFAGDAADDSLVAAMTREDDDIEPFTSVRDPLGLAQATFVLPVAHRTSLRVVLPAAWDRRDRPELDSSLPSGAAVVRGWDSHAERAARLELPDERLVQLYDAAVRNILVASGDGRVRPPDGRVDRWSVTDEARVVRSLVLAGLGDAAAAVVRRRGDEFELDGWFRREGPSLDRNAAIFHAVGDLWALTHDRATIDAVLGPAVKAAHWSERFRARRSRAIGTGEAYAMHDALLDLSRALEGVEQLEAAQDVAAFAARFVLDHDDRPAHTLTTASVEPIESRAGIDVLATTDRAVALATAGDERVMPLVGWLAEVAADRGRWPSFVHPRLGTGSGGAGDDPVVAAAIVELVRAFAARVDGRTLALLPLVPESWYGQNLDVRGLPTSLGACSFSLRWHGERPALLWELDTFDDEPLTITTPALDPTFRVRARRGEALLAAPSGAIEPGGVAAPDSGGSFA